MLEFSPNIWSDEEHLGVGVREQLADVAGFEVLKYADDDCGV